MALRDETELRVQPNHPSTILAKLDSMRREEEHCDCVLIVEDERYPAHRALLCAVSGYFRATFGTEFKETTTGEVYLRGLQKEAVSILLDFAYGERLYSFAGDSVGVLQLFDGYDASYQSFLSLYLSLCLSVSLSLSLSLSLSFSLSLSSSFLRGLTLDLVLFSANEVVINLENVQSLLLASCFLDFNEVFTKCADFLKWQIAPSNCIEMFAKGKLPLVRPEVHTPAHTPAQIGGKLCRGHPKFVWR
eukprot:sb/3468842/